MNQKSNHKQYDEADLIAGTWYMCMHVPYGAYADKNAPDSDGVFFKFLGDGNAELDSNAFDEPNEFGDVPDADYYVEC